MDELKYNASNFRKVFGKDQSVAFSKDEISLIFAINSKPYRNTEAKNNFRLMPSNINFLRT